MDTPIYEEAVARLSASPHAQYLGFGSPSAIDTLGVFTEPKDGWDSIRENEARPPYTEEQLRSFDERMPFNINFGYPDLRKALTPP